MKKEASRVALVLYHTEVHVEVETLDVSLGLLFFQSE